MSATHTLDRLGADYGVIEEKMEVGGLCSTFIALERFIFDKSLHVLHFRNS